MIVTIDDYCFDCTETGEISRLMKSGTWKKIPNRPNHCKGYNVIMINKKQYMRWQIIAHAFLKYDLNNKTVVVCYLDQNKLNSGIDNIDIRDKMIKISIKNSNKNEILKESLTNDESLTDNESMTESMTESS